MYLFFLQKNENSSLIQGVKRKFMGLLRKTQELFFYCMKETIDNVILTDDQKSRQCKLVKEIMNRIWNNYKYRLNNNSSVEFSGNGYRSILTKYADGSSLIIHDLNEISKYSIVIKYTKNANITHYSIAYKLFKK